MKLLFIILLNICINKVSTVPWHLSHSNEVTINRISSELLHRQRRDLFTLLDFFNRQARSYSDPDIELDYDENDVTKEYFQSNDDIKEMEYDENDVTNEHYQSNYDIKENGNSYYYEKANCDHLYENGETSEQDLNKPIEEGPINFSFIKTKAIFLT